MDNDPPRLIEVAFPLKQTSLDSVHEKNVRHGHISTLHIWPARRPLAACRAAIIATLLPDPGDPEKRKEILERLAGRVVQRVKRVTLPGGRVEEKLVEETEGGILHWGRESGPDLEWFRERIREAYGGRAPRVLDPFAGGGAIPLEAMRLGCQATAIDINPVAWFILKCTLEYPQKLAGQRLPLPAFALADGEFMQSYLKGMGQGKGGRQRTGEVQLGLLQAPEADLAWHVRAWGRWVLARARADLESFYPVIDGKPTVAYLWARTIECKACRATLPLLKTRWLCKKERKRVLLTMSPRPAGTGVDFGVETDVPVHTGTAAQRREQDKRLGAGTMSRSGGKCPCCGAIMTKEDIGLEGRAGHLGARMTSVVVEGQRGKEYRLPMAEEVRQAEAAAGELERVFADVPFGIPEEPITEDAKRNTWCVQYGVDRFSKLFTPRQLVALGTFVRHARDARDAMREAGYSGEWVEAIMGYVYCSLARLCDRNSEVCTWQVGAEKIGHTFTRFALPFTWDYVEIPPWTESSGGFGQAVAWVAQVAEHLTTAEMHSPTPSAKCQSVLSSDQAGVDLVVTDPPYYDAIGYSNLMDFFYVWLRRMLLGVSPAIDSQVAFPVGPKWDAVSADGELVDDASRFGNDGSVSRAEYEKGMHRAFQSCYQALEEQGRLVVVFASKQPNAWEALVSAVIRAGFVVDGSWPIQTERLGRMRSLSSAALASSVWLVCRKRPEAARPGWDNRVLEDMRERLFGRQGPVTGEWALPPRLREFWDAGIRGPDFVWAATGPALEAYSKHPVVKKANEPAELMTVTEFLGHVRRLVVDFAVGRVLSGNGGTDAVSGLDDVTSYYLLHRHTFGMDKAPAGAAILFALSCGLSDSDLAASLDVLVRSGGESDEDDGEEEDENAEEEPEDSGKGNKVRLKSWQQRKGKSLGYDSAGGRPAPLIDQVHRLMHLWRAGDVAKVNEYVDERGLRRHPLFTQLLQALIELSAAGSDERATLESISNHLAARGGGMYVPFQVPLELG